MSYLNFDEAVHLLRCRREWLERQLDRGLVRYKIKWMNGVSYYRLWKDDLLALSRPGPAPKPVFFTPEVERVVRAGKKQKLQLRLEAQQLGLTLEEYAREMGIDLEQYDCPPNNRLS